MSAVGASVAARAVPSSLRSLISRADRVRVCAVVLVVALVHAAVVWAWPVSPGAPTPIVRLVPSLLAILAPLLSHRTLAIRCVPPLPPRHADYSLLASARHYVRRLLGCAVFAALVVASSLVFHAQLLRPCDGPSACASANAATAAAWAALIGAAQGVAYWREVWRGGTRGVMLAWPLVQRDAFLRLRPLLRTTATDALKASTCVLAVVLLLLAVPTQPLHHLGWRMLPLFCSCGGGGAGAGVPLGAAAGEEGALAAAAAILPLLLAGICFQVIIGVGVRLIAILYTQRLVFGGPLMGRRRAAAPAAGGGLPDERRLIEALSRHDAPLTQHLAFLDLLLLSEYEPARRAALFTYAGSGGASSGAAGGRAVGTTVTGGGVTTRASAAQQSPGAGWPKFMTALLDPIDQLAVVLTSMRKQRADIKQAEAKLLAMGKGGPAALVKLRQHRAHLREHAVWELLFGPAQLVGWAAQAAANLVAASCTEDSLGMVQLDRSLEKTLGSLLECLLALESYAGSGAAVGASAALGAGGGAARGRRLQPLPQQAALHVSQSAPSQVRSNAVHKAGALEAALQRSVQLLASTFRQHLRGLRLTPERQSKLEQLLGSTL